MIIDAHTHIGGMPYPPFDNVDSGQLLEMLLKEMENHHIDHALILPIFGEDERDPSMETVLKLTDGIKNVSVLGTVDVIDQWDDLGRLRELLSDKEIVGVKLYPGYQYFYPYEKRCDPIYELCMEFNVPVIFHSGDTTDENALLEYARPIHIDRVAVRFPELKIIIAHLGNPWLTECKAVLYKNNNVYADLSGLVVNDSLENAHGRDLKEEIDKLIHYAGADKLLYGTDWPVVTDMKMYINFVTNLDIPHEDLDRVFYENAMDLFGIKL